MSHYGHRKPLDRQVVNRVQFYLDDDDYADLLRMAEEQRTSVSQLVRKLIADKRKAELEVKQKSAA